MLEDYLNRTKKRHFPLHLVVENQRLTGAKSKL